jgi:micrococcal nuclease
VGRIGKNVANIAAFVLALAVIYGLWEYTGRLVEKPEKPPAVVQQEPSKGDVLYSDILPAGTNPAVAGKEGPADVQDAPAEAGPPEKEVAPVPPQAEPQQPSVETPAQEEYGRCVDVYDGDTITVRLYSSPQELTKVRLIGVDAPELEKGEFGETAGYYTRSLLDGHKVKLVFDKERYDKYGRLLAYVYLEDGTFVNARLVEEGYARVASIPPNTAHADEFEALQAEARKEQRGIWADPPPLSRWREYRVLEHWIF